MRISDWSSDVCSSDLAIVDFFEIGFHQAPSAVLVEDEQMPSARWFPGATVNFAEHLLRRRDDAVAVVALDESGGQEQLTWAELAAHVAGLQKNLQAAGVSKERKSTRLNSSH